MNGSALGAYHQWLLGRPRRLASSIVISCPELGMPSLGSEVANYLNEFDDEAEGQWLAVGAELVRAIAGDPGERNLLGVKEPCAQCPPVSACGQKRVYEALAKRGHVVMSGILAMQATVGWGDVFRVGIGGVKGEEGALHVWLDPLQFHGRCLSTIVGDTYLEWEATRLLADTV